METKSKHYKYIMTIAGATALPSLNLAQMALPLWRSKVFALFQKGKTSGQGHILHAICVKRSQRVIFDL